MVKHKYWVPCLFENNIEAEVGQDGLLFKFNYKDIENQLQTLPSGRYGWFFNESRDRYCAEMDGDQVIVNSSIVIKWFGVPIT